MTCESCSRASRLHLRQCYSVSYSCHLPFKLAMWLKNLALMPPARRNAASTTVWWSACAAQTSVTRTSPGVRHRKSQGPPTPWVWPLYCIFITFNTPPKKNMALDNTKIAVVPEIVVIHLLQFLRCTQVWNLNLVSLRSINHLWAMWLIFHMT